MTNPRRTHSTKRNRLITKVKREENYCHLCGHPVDVKLTHGKPESPEIDELIPVSLGGNPYDRENVRLSHRWCNRFRSNNPVQQTQNYLRQNPPPFILQTKLTNPTSSRKW